MRFTGLTKLTSVAAAALLSIPAALAQPPPMAGQPVPGKNAEQRVENRIKELHKQLQITQAEEPQWNEFAQVMRENAREMDRVFMQRAQQFASMNAVQNMQSYEQISQEHAQLVQKLVPAFQKLYEAMPEQQKRLADQVFRANAEKHIQRAAQSHRG
jgi:truncated hemoglobin YjbI